MKMAKNKNKKKKNNRTKPNTHQQEQQGGIRKSYRIGALVICAIIVISLVVMYAI